MKRREVLLREVLRRQFERKRRRNASYSLRAFARDLEVTVATLSRIMSGKSNASSAMMDNIICSLDISDEERDLLLRREIDPFIELKREADIIQFVENWQDAAIAALIETRGFLYDEAWIAQRLNLPKAVVRTSLDRLFRIGLVQKEPSGRLAVQDIAITSTAMARPPDRPDPNLLAKIARMRQALEDATPESKANSDISSVTLAIDRKKLPEAKRRIMRFRRSLSKYLDSGDKDEVYVLMLGLFPVSK